MPRGGTGGGRSPHVGGMIDRLEVQNFKSYKKHQVLGPFKQFTAVIGPNGSGKSNLMDAISFVLGVQSKQLRGNTLADLMYSGAGRDESQKAFVKLVFRPDPQGDEEVHFSRTLAANGTTAYQLDDRHCSWDQYNAKLLSYNVIVKAKNFLVFQGDVETIASKSPKDLTELFEKIAGSDELRERYDELEKGKDEAEEAVSRSFAKKKALASEKKMAKTQKDEADKHLSKEAELEAQQRDLALFKLYHVDQQAAEERDAAAKLGEAASEAKAAATAAEKEAAGLKREQQGTAKAALVAERKAQKQRDLLEEQAPLRVKNTEEGARAVKRLKRLEVALANAQKADAERTKTLAKLDADLADLQAAQATYDASRRQQAAASGDLSLGEEQLSEYNRRKEEAGAKTYKLKQERDVLEMEHTREHEELANLEANVAELDARAARLDAATQRTQEEVTSKRAEQKEDKATTAALKKQHQTLADNSRRSGIQADQVKAELEEVEGKLREAKADAKESERDRRLIETVEALKRTFSGVRGRLVDLIKVPQRKHNLAVTVALGRHMDAIVVDDDKTGKECIGYLKTQRHSPLSFIPLSSIRVQTPDERLRALGGTAKLVVDVLQYDASLERALFFALGSTLVCDTHAEAKKLGYGAGGAGSARHKVVSLDGTLIAKGGTITGGISRGTEAKAAGFDRAALDGLRAQRQQCVETLQTLGSVRDRELQLQQAKETLASVENKMRMTDEEIKQAKAKLAKLASEKANLDTARPKLLPEIRTLQAKLTERGAAITKLTKRTNEISDRIFAEFSKSVGVASIREYEETNVAAAQQAAQRRMQFSSQAAKLKSAAQYERSRDTAKPVAETTATIATLQTALQTATDQEALLQTTVQEITAALEAVTAELAVRKDAADAVDVRVRELKEVAHAKAASVAKLKRQLAAHETTLDVLAEERTTLLRSCPASLVTRGGDADAAQASGEGGDDADAMDVDGDGFTAAFMGAEGGAGGAGDGTQPVVVDYSKMARHLRQTLTDAQRTKLEQEFKKKIDEITTELAKLAPNLKAVEQYEALKERERVMGEELSAAKEAAKEAAEDFEEVKANRTAAFMLAFDHISREIDPIYKELTTKPGPQVLGGQAYLTLENQDEPFLHGVKFTAMPPTKRFRDMEQLSGGEKTVAALGLLFAIHSFHPSPFFVLDEVDAALDNTNVEKVANYIMQKSHQSQAEGGFQSVVISLKDMFYDKADALIGVCRDPVDNSSITFSFDLERFQPATPEE